MAGGEDGGGVLRLGFMIPKDRLSFIIGSCPFCQQLSKRMAACFQRPDVRPPAVRIGTCILVVLCPFGTYRAHLLGNVCGRVQVDRSMDGWPGGLGG